MEKLILVYILLLLIGIIYNRLVDRLERDGLLSGLKAFLVVGGCTYTIVLSAPLIGLEHTAIIAGSFVFALLPVTVGEIKRHLATQKTEASFWENLTKKEEEKDDA
ncbi:MAG: hypothetical protein GY805_35875 [Chloroflexi bacterium]|nr:hypothetical protein [Chloroflexota bacterium]